MKREFLEGLDLGEGVKLPKSAVAAIMAENGKDIEAAKAPIATLTAEKKGLQTRLEEANRKLEGYDPEWKTKAEQADEDAKAKIAEMQTDMLIRDAMAKYTFTSTFAKDGVTAKVKAAGLKAAEDGESLLGLDDLMKDIQKQNPDAFKVEDDKGGAGGGKLPFGVAGTQKPGAAKIEEAGNLREALGAALFPKN